MASALQNPCPAGHGRPCESVLRAVWETCPCAAVSTGPDGCILDANPAFERLVGARCAELAGTPADVFDPEAHLPGACGEMRAELARGGIWAGKVRHRWADGTLLWADVTVRPVPGEPGAGFVAVAHGVARGMVAGQAAAQFFDQPLTLNLVATPAGIVLAANAAWKRVLGYDIEEIEGRAFIDLVHPDDCEPTMSQMATLGRGEDVLGFENRYRHKDGTWRTLRWAAQARGEDGLIYAVATDITERVEARAAAEKSRALLQAAGEMARVGAWELDMATGILSWEENLCAMLDAAPGFSVPVARANDEFVRPEGREKLVAAIGAAVERGVPWDIDLPMLTVARRPFWGRMIGRPVVEGGRTVRILGTFQDITPQKELERSLQEALGRAEAGARAKSEFLAVMSHELRTPLNGVLGFSEILAGTPLDADQKVYANTIRESGEHLLAVVNDILDFSSFERGAVGLHNAPFDTARLVRSAMESIAKAAADKDLDVRLEQSPAVPARITGDAWRAGQVLNNLLANAVKFTARGSVVLRVAPSTHAGVPCVDFAVEDTGIGISPASIDNLFRAFTQADSSSRRAFGGTGLGLAIARRLSEAMGGEITVVSAPERGSTFTFHLPLAPAAAPPSGPISRPSQERGDCWSL